MRTRPISATLFGFMVSAVVSGAASASEPKSDLERFTTAPPSGFEQLEADRELVLDVYYDGEKRGTARVALFGDRIRFLDPRLVAAFALDVTSREELTSLLSAPLQANRHKACGLSQIDGCGFLDAANVGVIVDEDRFRVDVFVNPQRRHRMTSESDEFLEEAAPRFSLVSLVGSTLSGSTEDGSTRVRIQNRTVAALGAARIRSDASYGDTSGLSVDNLAVEVDKDSWRFTAGQFWVPGTELISRRKTIGVGLTTQFDTRKNRAQLLGTPVELFLGTMARVEVFIDGQLYSSQILSAGNRALDTTNWPVGAYNVVLRIHERGRAVREESRFFSRDETLAPLGHPVLQFYAGVHSSGQRFQTSIPFMQGAIGYRLSERSAIRTSLVALKSKVVGDVSTTYATDAATFAFGGLLTSKGEVGAVFRGFTTAVPRLSASFDLRKIWGGRNRPLLPVSERSESFAAIQTGLYDQGSFTQLSGQASTRLGSSTWRLSGYYRDTPGERAAYSFGPSVDIPLVRMERFQIVGEGDFRASDTGRAAYAGIRLLASRGAQSLGFRGGIQSLPGDGLSARGEIQAATSGETANKVWSTNAAIGRGDGGEYARVAGDLRTSAINIRGEALHEFGSRTQFSTTAETGFAFSEGTARISGGSMKESAAMVAFDGPRSTSLDVFVDDVKVGRMHAGAPLVVYLEPYREYRINARPQDGAFLSGDLMSRKVTAYPGTVTRLSWKMTRYFVGYGRLVDERGAPVGAAKLNGARGVADTDAEGYFQIDLEPAGVVSVERNGAECKFAAPISGPDRGYVSMGDVQCL